MIRCPQCGQYNEDNFKYCGKCGSEINSVKFCQFCNAQNNVNNTSCINCGKPFDTNVTTQLNQQNYNYQQHTPMNSNKLDLKALLAGSISIPIIIMILGGIIYSLYMYRNITYSGFTVLIVFSIMLSGFIGMIIFNKINREENRQINILFLSFTSTILFSILVALFNTYGFDLRAIILVFIFILVGAFIGDYVEKNGKI